ncbi:helix-turn-helix domain-containing protein [Paenibacillus contaminans]|uniref:HTH araC/xylS-type domain-containing protein n=1 Tax=Paenibacillus contaminans TaxID=450362 RepID=A0A329MLT4_9BACL|nr:helix-turn-helix domain-containing protein [Paenibacillus contaminans]RAV20891.1 hypothetical protein DQG23_12420 [Paenibacillus contaminans]
MLNRWPLFRRSRNYYFRLMTFTLLVTLLPIMLLSFLYYRNTMAAIKLELHTANSNYLNQTATAVEIIVNQIGKSVEQLTMDSSLRAFENFPQGHYYEHISGTLKDEDLTGLERYISSKQKVWNMLDNMKSSNEYIHSVQLIDRAKEIVLSSVDYPEEQPGEPVKMRLPEQVMTYPYFMDIQNVKQRNGSQRQILPLIYQSPSMKNVVIVNLDVRKLYDNVIKKLENQAGRQFFILSAENKLIVSDGLSDEYGRIGDELMSRKKTDAPGVGPAVLDEEGKNRLILYKTSSALGWTFVATVNLNRLYDNVSSLRGLLLMESFILVAVAAGLAFMTSRSMYLPVFRLLTYIRNISQSEKGRPDEMRPLDEFKLIQSSFEEAIADRRSLQSRLKESLPAYREKFLVSLVRGDKYDKEETVERMAFLGIDFCLEQIVLLNVYYEQPGSAGRDFANDNLNKLRMKDELERCFALKRHVIVVEMANDLFTVLMNWEEERMADIFALAEAAQEEIKLSLGIHSLMGIGRFCSDANGLKRAFEEAEEAVRCRNIAGAGAVVYIEDVRLEGTPALYYPKEKETTLNRFIKNGDALNAKRMLAEFVADLKSQQACLHFHQVQRVFVQLLASFMETADQLRFDLEAAMQTKTNLYGVLLQKRNMNETFSWLEEVIQFLCDRIDSAFRTKSRTYVEEAIRLIERHYADELSLTWVADRLQLNPSYLSRMFKEKQGIGFMEYVTIVRIEKSKQMLLETGMKVKDICDRLGYTKVNSFIRIFKQLTGKTPGEYRKSYEEK